MSSRAEFPGVALVTGAGGSGIGNAIARAFVLAGCTRIAITDLSPSTLSETKSELRSILAAGREPTDVLSISGDISDPAFVRSFFEAVKSAFGRIDYAVNCAGIIGNSKATAESSLEAFDKVNGVNYRGLWMCVREELRIMREQDFLPLPAGDQEGGGSRRGEVRRQRGSIVNIASQLGIVGRPNSPAYCAGKSAVIGLTRCDAIDASPYRIRVNAVCPGVIDTPLMDADERAAVWARHPGAGAATSQFESQGSAVSAPPRPKDGSAGDLGTFVAVAPMDRMGTPDEVADVVLFLSSEKASFVQGAAWVVDGGYTIN